MNNTILLTLSAASMLALGSCLGGESSNSYRTSETYGGDQCFNYVTDSETQKSFITYNPTYTFDIEHVDRTIDIGITGLALQEGYAGLALRLPSMQLKTDPSYSYVVSDANFHAEGTTAYTFDTFTLRALQRYVSGPSSDSFYAPVYQLSYRVNSRYDVTVFPTNYVLLGQTSAVTLDDAASAYATKNVLHTITLDTSKGTAKMIIDGARYCDAMSPERYAINGLPYTVDAGGITILTPQDEAYTPLSAGDMLKNCKVKNIHILIAVPSGDTSISYDAYFADLQDNPAITDYAVTTSAGYLYYTE